MNTSVNRPCSLSCRRVSFRPKTARTSDSTPENAMTQKILRQSPNCTTRLPTDGATNGPGTGTPGKGPSNPVPSVGITTALPSTGVPVVDDVVKDVVDDVAQGVDDVLGGLTGGGK